MTESTPLSWLVIGRRGGLRRRRPLISPVAEASPDQKRTPEHQGTDTQIAQEQGQSPQKPIVVSPSDRAIGIPVTQRLTIAAVGDVRLDQYTRMSDKADAAKKNSSFHA